VLVAIKSTDPALVGYHLPLGVFRQAAIDTYPSVIRAPAAGLAADAVWMNDVFGFTELWASVRACREPAIAGRRF